MSQLRRQLLRLLHGLRFFSDRGKKMTASYRSEQIWICSLKDGVRILQRADIILRDFYSLDGILKEKHMSSLLNSLVYATIGPKPCRDKARKTKSPFDLFLPLSQDEFEDFGVGVAYYTLGCFADQPDIDLPGFEWSENLRIVFEKTDKNLNSFQRKRREKILRHLDNAD